jgi:hypothetical protein
VYQNPRQPVQEHESKPFLRTTQGLTMLLDVTALSEYAQVDLLLLLLHHLHQAEVLQPTQRPASVEAAQDMDVALSAAPNTDIVALTALIVAAAVNPGSEHVRKCLEGDSKRMMLGFGLRSIKLSRSNIILILFNRTLYALIILDYT